MIWENCGLRTSLSASNYDRASYPQTPPWFSQS